MDYSFDTSAFVEPWIRLYSPDVMGTVWEWISLQINGGRIRAIDEVLRELEVQDDDLTAWAKLQTGLFVPIDEDIQHALTEIINRFPAIYDFRRSRSSADPWVIATALTNGCPVVSYENLGKLTKPKIPDVCQYYGIRHIQVIDVLRETGFSR